MFNNMDGLKIFNSPNFDHFFQRKYSYVRSAHKKSKQTNKPHHKRHNISYSFIEQKNNEKYIYGTHVEPRSEQANDSNNETTNE